MRVFIVMSIITVLGLMLAVPNEGVAAGIMVPQNVTVIPVADKKPLNGEAPTDRNSEKAYDPEVLTPEEKEKVCDELDRLQREAREGGSTKKPKETREPEAKNDGSPEVTMVADENAEDVRTKEQDDLADKINKTKAMCAKVELTNIAVKEGMGAGSDTPAVADMPVTTPNNGGANYNDRGAVPTTPVVATGSGMDGMLQQIQQQMQQQMQQQIQQQMQAQLGGGMGQGQCPVGTTLTQMNGQMVCVGKVGSDTASGTCVTLSGKNYCRENNCTEDGRDVVRINGVTYCTSSAVISKPDETPAARDGYADGFASKGGECGRDVAKNYTNNQEYLAGYARGLTDCRAALVKRTSTTVVATGVDDVAVRAKCKTQIEQLAKKMELPTCLLEMAFRKQADLGGANQCVAGEGTTESDVFGYDGARQQRLLIVKAQFDAGKVDAINGKVAQPKESLHPEAYALGHSCGGNLK